MHRITLTVAPGIWRLPEWILDEFERIAKKHHATNLVDAINIVCRQQSWRFEYARTEHGAIVSLAPMRALPRTYEGHVDVDVPIDLAAPVAEPTPPPLVNVPPTTLLRAKNVLATARNRNYG